MKFPVAPESMSAVQWDNIGIHTVIIADIAFSAVTDIAMVAMGIPTTHL